MRTKLHIRIDRGPQSFQQYTKPSTIIMVGNLVFTLFSVAALHSGVHAVKTCKATPYSNTWPSEHDWQALNNSIDGRLLKTVPAASSCWPGNPYGSQVSCDAVDANWTSGIFHAARPESIDYPIWANNSCLPPSASGYDKQQGCELGGLPEFIVNATQECHVATALKWADERNVRVSVKGTGHDMNGRYDIRANFRLTWDYVLTCADRVARTRYLSGHDIFRSLSSTRTGNCLLEDITMWSSQAVAMAGETFWLQL